MTGKELNPNPDGIHINAESQRRFGIRYFEAYRTKSNVDRPLDNETELVKAYCEKEQTIAEKRYRALEQFTLGKGSMEEVMKFFWLRLAGDENGKEEDYRGLDLSAEFETLSHDVIECHSGFSESRAALLSKKKGQNMMKLQK